ncbi:alpha/beta hydrolase [Bacillus cereus]|uniref:alpha/beta fold hydrolase n=1 Tax=Bacillus TaxID=1386 RepID=UPI000553BC58|nr:MULTISPECIES: alpha/beta hydrolase [unclassified Bacillus (in: firmicutes)]
MKRWKLYMLSCFVLTTLTSCSTIEKQTEKATHVKETFEAKFETKEKMLEIDGQTIYFKQIGKNKPPLLMLHGFGGSSNGFSDIYPDLAKNHTVIAVDILGFGHSSKPMDFRYSFPNQANLYYKLMKKLGYDTFAILGHSMGGEISLNLTYLYPDAVTHLILTDAIGAETLQHGKGSPKPKLSNDLSTVSTPKEFHEEEVKNNRDDTTHHDELGKMWPRRLRINADEIQLPTLLIWGRHDQSVAWQKGETYHQFLKNSTFHIIEEGEHAPFRQQPKEFMQYVDEFFKQHPNTK